MNNNSQKLVSVIIGAYNCEKYISQTIESVRNQTYKNIEIIIINDGSTDTTLQIAEQYAAQDSRIVVHSQVNKGVSAARNAGFALAKGEYFCVFDADDIMLPTKIQSQVEFLESNPSADFVYSKVYYFIDGAYDIYRHSLTTVSGARVYKKLLQKGNFIYTGTVFFKRSVFDAYGGFDENLRSAEEYDYWLSLAVHGVVFLHQDEYLTLCRSRQDGLTSDSVTMYATTMAVLEKHRATATLQYSKAKLLLSISKFKKPSSSVQATSSTTTTFGIRCGIHRVFTALKNMKFALTFHKIRDKKLHDFLISIESRNHI